MQGKRSFVKNGDEVWSGTRPATPIPLYSHKETTHNRDLEEAVRETRLETTPWCVYLSSHGLSH